jgi:hypothetical protein
MYPSPVVAKTQEKAQEPTIEQVYIEVPKPNLDPPARKNAPQRNNNPLNIEYGKFSQRYGAELDTIGKRFAKFPTPEAGFQAARDLLLSDGYDRPLEQAMRRWSGGGYGAEISPINKRIREMTTEELDKLIQNMAKREGWYTK